jgi:hypothetical protein
MSTDHQGLSQAEIDALEGDELDETGIPKEDDADRAEAARAKGEPGADDGDEGEEGAEADDDKPAAEPPAAAPAAPAPAPVEAPAPAPEAAAAPVEPPAEPPAAAEEAPELPREVDIPDPILVQVQDPKKLADAREAAEAKIDDIEKKWSANELTDDERNAQMKAARRELTAAVSAEAANQARIETNAANAEQQQRRVIDGIVKIAKTEGSIDYAKDAKAEGQFNRALQVLYADPDSKGKSFAAISLEAHRMVCAMRGVTPKVAPAPAPVAAPTPPKPAAAPAPAKAARTPVDKSLIPPTLSRVPPAADATISGDEFSHLANLDGAELEKAVTKMTAEQQERWLNS